MTIKQIKSILPSPLIITLQDIQNSRIAIDTSIFLYKFKYVKPIEQEFIGCFKILINQFIKNEIRFIFVFDGKPPELKQQILDGRQKRKTDDENAVRITKQDVDALKLYFDENEIEYHLADGEAEKTCCQLEMDGFVDYVLSNDFDTFLFGAKKLIRSNKGMYELYTWESISEALKLTRKEFQLMAIAIGFDYLPQGIRGFGPKKSLEYIQKFKCLPKHDISQELLNSIYKEFEMEVGGEPEL